MQTESRYRAALSMNCRRFNGLNPGGAFAWKSRGLDWISNRSCEKNSAKPICSILTGQAPGQSQNAKIATIFCFWLPHGDQAMAIVRLTWKGDREADESWPRTRLLNTLAEFVERELVPANAEWSSS